MLATADLHTHSSFPFDAGCDPALMLEESAAQRGLRPL
mgnify:FL=1